MKKLLLLLCTCFILLLLMACNEDNPPDGTTETDSILDSKTVHHEDIGNNEPPDEHEDIEEQPGYEQEDLHETEEINFPDISRDALINLMRKADLNWQPVGQPRVIDDISSSHQIATDDGFLRAVLLFERIFSFEGDEMRTAVAYLGPTNPQLNQHFRENYWQELWDVLAQSTGFVSQVSQLSSQAIEYFSNIDEDSSGSKLWRGRVGEINAEVLMTVEAGETIPILSHFGISTIPAFFDERDILNLFYEYDAQIRSTDQLALLTSTDQFRPIFARGTLSNFEPVSSDFRRVLAFAGWPTNYDLYRRATLSDQNGSITVYLLPTFYSEQELSGQMLHTIYLVETPEQFLFIRASFFE